MKRLRCCSFIALVALLGLGCATVAPPASPPTAPLTTDSSCRNIPAPDGKVQRYCGSAAQWVEFDRRAALIQAGVTCRWANTPRELCLNASQWKTYELRQASASDALNMALGKETIGAGQNNANTTITGPVTMDPPGPGQ